MGKTYQLCLIFTLVVAISCTLKRERIRLFDKNPTHHLFGGNSVVSSYGKFQYYEIKNTMEEIID